jgi:SPP1 family phage portal protein
VVELENIEILEIIKKYHQSEKRRRLCELTKMYDGDNPAITARWRDKEGRGRTPNNLIPTAYYSTVVDSMAGFMFQNVQYTAIDESKQEALNELIRREDFAVKDMRSGISALAYNKGIEYIYTDDKPEVKVGQLDPINTIIGYSDDIEKRPIWAINYGIEKVKEKNKYTVLYITKDEDRRFTAIDKVITDIDTIPLYFDELPVVDYRAQIIGYKAPFEVVIPYIVALDALVSGNANEVDRLVDAILVLGKTLDSEELRHMEEWKALMAMSTDDRAEYLVKDTSPEFRRYVSDMLIREIHKHSHVIDWYSSDNGNTADASGKALRTRLYDMETYSKRIELAYKLGANKRWRLVDSVLQKQNKGIGAVDIKFKRTMVDDFIDDAVKLSQVTFLTDITKREKLGIDEGKEQERIEKERPTAEIIEV